MGPEDPHPLQDISGLTVLILGCREPGLNLALDLTSCRQLSRKAGSPSWCLEQLWLQADSHAVCIDILGSKLWEFPLQGCRVFPTCFLPGVAAAASALWWAGGEALIYIPEQF